MLVPPSGRGQSYARRVTFRRQFLCSSRPLAVGISMLGASLLGGNFYARPALWQRAILCSARHFWAAISMLVPPSGRGQTSPGPRFLLSPCHATSTGLGRLCSYILHNDPIPA